MGAATSWGELALKTDYLSASARRKGVPPHALEDVVGDAVLDCLEREAKGQGFPKQAVAAKGILADAMRRSIRLARQPEQHLANRRELSIEDEETLDQIAEWQSLSGREKARRAQESRVALGTSLTLETSGFGRARRKLRSLR